MVVRHVVFVFHVARNGEVDVVVAAAGVWAVLRFSAENTAVAVEVVGLDKSRDVLVIAVIDEKLSVVLVFGDVQLRDLVVVEGGEVVEVLLIEVEENGVVGRTADELELMGGKFRHHHCLFGHLVEDVEEGHADVAGKDGVPSGAFQKVVDKGGRGAFALGAGDAHDLFVIGLQKQIGLGGDALNIDEVVGLRKTDAGGFEDEIVFVEPLVVAGSRDEFQFAVVKFIGFEVGIAVCHGEGHFGEVLADETVGGDTFFAESEDDDFFVTDGIYNVIG